MKKLRLVISHIFLEHETKLKISSEIKPPLKDTLFVNCARSGTFLHKILVKYASFKEVTMICGLPDKPWQVNKHRVQIFIKGPIFASVLYIETNKK